MDWSFDETQTAVADLSRQLLAGPDAWPALAAAGLLDLDSLATHATLLIEVGRAGGRVPALETLVLGGPIRAHAPGTDPAEILTAGLIEAGSRDPARPATRHEGGRLHGTKLCVPAADRATRMVVSARDGTGDVGLYVVALADCRLELQRGTNDEALATVHLDGAPATRLGGPEALPDWLRRIDVGISALLLGLATEALAMTARYVSEREQFGRKIGTFQAVSQRAADAWIETQAMQVTLWQAAWRLDAGLPADREVAIARYTAAEGSHRVLAAAQHLHGGMGFDRDYALHRYFLTAKAWEFVLGGASAQLERLGDRLAAEPAGP